MNDKIYIASQNGNHFKKFNNYAQLLAYGQTAAGWQFWSVDKKAFNSLYNTARAALVCDPIAWTFNRLHREHKTQSI